MSACRVSLAMLSWVCVTGAAWPVVPEAETVFAQFFWQRGLETFHEASKLRHDAAKAKELFAKAADDMAKGISSRSDRSEAYHDLGNAYLLAGKLPEALAAFHRGLRLAPQDRQLRTHLEYARAMVVYGASGRGRFAGDAWPRWLPRPSAAFLVWVMLGAYGVMFLALTRGSLTGRWRWHVLAGLSLLVLGGTGFFWHQHMHAEPTRVIIAQDDLPLRQGNGPSYPAHPDLPYLSRGMEAKRLAQRGGWLRVQFDTGEIGWVPQQDVLVVE